MGLYDCLTCNDPRFVCSEGHHLGAEEFQTKDLGCTMGHGEIDATGTFSFLPGGWGDAEVGTTINIYTSCRQCPAFVQAGTGNLIEMWVEFAVDLVAPAALNSAAHEGRIAPGSDPLNARTRFGALVVDVRRTSQPTAEQIATMPNEPYMEDAAGPMPWPEALARHQDSFARWLKERALDPGTEVQDDLAARASEAK